jgi:hypothetical protein
MYMYTLFEFFLSRYVLWKSVYYKYIQCVFKCFSFYASRSSLSKFVSFLCSMFLVIPSCYLCMSLLFFFENNVYIYTYICIRFYNLLIKPINALSHIKRPLKDQHSNIFKNSSFCSYLYLITFQ